MWPFLLGRTSQIYVAKLSILDCHKHAFLFGPLWYLAKGMWQKALVLFGIGFFTYGIASAIIAGISGHRDYMRHYNTGKQFWW